MPFRIEEKIDDSENFDVYAPGEEVKARRRSNKKIGARALSRRLSRAEAAFAPMYKF